MRCFLINTYVKVTLSLTALCVVSSNTLNAQPNQPRSTPSWSNPVMSPYGVSIVEVLRGHFMTGQTAQIEQFTCRPKGMTGEDVLILLEQNEWGYEIFLTGASQPSSADSTIILTYRTKKNLTSGIDRYKIKVINDTARVCINSDGFE